jgi:hypothetical protein
MSDSRLDPEKQHDFGVPKNGNWRFNLKAMLANAPEGTFVVGWDTPPTAAKPKGAKCYGWYETPEQCYEELSKNNLTCCYEVYVYGKNYSDFRNRFLVKACGDLEWEGDLDTEHRHARKHLRRLHVVCETKLGFTPEVYVLGSTRKVFDEEVDPETGVVSRVWNGVWKNSYHFIIANLWAEKSKHIKQLFLPETLRTGVEDDLKEFDLSVYAKSQLMRMPLCSKRGSDVIFRRINENPFDPEDDLTTKFDDDNLAAIRPALVTVFDKTKTMHLLKKWTLVPKPKPLPSAGAKRAPSKASLDTPGRDLRQRSGIPFEKPSDIAYLLVGMHPDQIGHGYDSWRDVVFGVTNAAGNSPEVVKILKEWTRVRPKADRRDQEWPRIEAGNFASKAGGGDGTTIGMGGLVYRHEQYPAVCDCRRTSNGEPFPNCRTLIDPEDVWVFDLFVKFLRHVHFQKIPWKWLVQFAYYVVQKLKDQMYAIIQGEYAGVTKADFDAVWNVEQPSEIYGLSFKRYLEDIVGEINSYIPPLVTTAVGEPDGEATASPAETVRASQSEDLEDIHTLLEIIKTTASHSTKNTRIAELMRTGVLHNLTLKCFPEWDHVTGQADGEPDWDDMRQSLENLQETLQTQLIKASTSQQTADGKTQEADTIVIHVKTTLKPKARVQWSKRCTIEEVVAMIIKISPHVHSLQPVGELVKTIRGTLKVQPDDDMEQEVKRLVEQWKSMQGKEPDTEGKGLKGMQTEDVARDQNSVGDVSEEHTNGESMEVTSDHSNHNDESMEDTPEEHNTDESMEDTCAVECGNAVVMTDMQADSDGKDNADFTSLQELASSHPIFVWKHDITTASRSDSPATKMIKVFLKNLDRRQLTDDLTLIRTCCLLQMARADNSQIQDDNTVPEELFKFLQGWSEQQGRLFDDKAAKRVKAAWECARVDIEKGPDWQLFADSLWLEIFNNLFSYKAVKKKFELRNFKVMDMSCYAFITSDGKPTPRKQAELSTNYGNLWCWSRVVTPVSDDNEEEIVEFKCTKFLPSWFNDESMRTYAKFDCIAPSKSGHVVPPDVFNTWTGFLAANLPAVPDDEVAELIEPFIQHYRLVICSTEEQVQFQLAWFARQVQDPANKTGVGIIYMGDQGVGKDIVTEFIVEKVFGTDVATQSGEVTHLFEKHSLERENKVLCVLDEASGATVKEYIPNIKATMVAPRISFNAKFGAIYKLLCIINYMFTSNDTLPMPIEASDRRMVVFQCNNSKKGDTGYFNTILRSAANPRAARAFFQFLQKFDLSGYENFQACRPETAMYRRLKEMSLSLFYQFMSFKCVQQADFEYDVQGATYIFDSLKEWADGANIKRSDYTKKQLGLDFAHLMENYADHGVTKNRRSSGMQYRIEWAKLEACLKRHSLFDSNAM